MYSNMISTAYCTNNLAKGALRNEAHQTPNCDLDSTEAYHLQQGVP